jgi:Flp pilus assembly protein TadG
VKIMAAPSLNRYRKRSRCLFFNSENGAIVAAFMVVFPVLLAFIALATEVAFIQVKQNRLQAAADAAVFAAAITRNRGGNLSAMQKAAEDTAASVFDSVPSVSIETFTSDASKVRVTLETELPLLISQAFAKRSGVTARGIATVQVQAGNIPTCLHALEATREKALYLVGNYTTNLKNCNFYSNSTHNAGLYVERSTSAYCGSYRATKYFDKVKPILTCSTAPLPSVTLPDPLASRNLVVPTLTARSVPSSSSGTSTFEPGRYGNVDISSGNIVFNPGTYVFTGTFKLTTSGTVTGNGVTLIYNSTAGDVDLAKANFQLKAPTSGTFEGIVFWSNRSSLIKYFDVNANSDLNGFLYAPTGTLQIDGNISNTIGCPKFVARYVWVTGNVNLTINCPGVDLKLSLVE